MVGEVFKLQNAALLKCWFVHNIIKENVGRWSFPQPTNGCKSNKSFCNGEDKSMIINFYMGKM